PYTSLGQSTSLQGKSKNWKSKKIERLTVHGNLLLPQRS
ncbi:MAG: hypothetical protein ACJA2O_004053, partial [Candidatus Azotimanducaceae bacterium]